jgi:hypothetical protein
LWRWKVPAAAISPHRMLGSRAFNLSDKSRDASEKISKTRMMAYSRIKSSRKLSKV